MKTKTIAVHQPDFMPWMGFFDKIARVDAFVILDHVVNNPRTASYYRRVTMLISGRPIWVTLTLKRPDGLLFQPIMDMELDMSKKNWAKIRDSIQQSYARASYFREVFPLVEEYIECEDNSLSFRNINFIKSVCSMLNLHTPFVRSSELSCKRSSTELLIEICQKTDANRYMCGGGAGGYQEDGKFNEAGIELVYQSFSPPVYSQVNTEGFVPGLSILDALMNLGPVELSAMLRRD